MGKTFWVMVLSLALLLRPGGAAIAQEAGRYVGVSAERPTGSSAISADGLVVAYDFETYTGDGLLRDFGPFGNHGKVSRREDTSGLFGSARVFRDLEDVVDLPEDLSLALDGPLTVATWIRLATPNLHQHIFSCDDMYVLWTTDTNQYRLADTQANGLTTAQGTTPIGSWHSVVAVLDARRGDALTRQNIRIFIDGAPVAGTLEPTWAPGSFRTDSACLIGASVAEPLSHQLLHFEGALDELEVFSRALSDDEIRAYARR